MMNSALASSRPSYRPRRPAIRTAIRHTHCLSVYRFQSPRDFLQARHAGRCLSATHRRLVSRLVLSRLAKRLVSIYRIVYQCRIRYTVPSGLAHRVLFAHVSSPGVAYGIAIIPSTSPHIFIVFLYLCIFISFIYIAYIIFIIYIHRRDIAPGTRSRR